MRLSAMNLLKLIIICVFCVFHVGIVAGQTQCEIVTVTNDGTDSMIKFTILEKSRIGELVGNLIVKHESTVASADVLLSFVIQNGFFSIANRKSLNATHTQFDLIVKNEYYLFDQNQMSQVWQKLVCEPNRGFIDVVVTFRDVNEKPTFNVPSMTYDLPKFPINLPFSKLYAPIIVAERDANTSIFGKLKFVVWNDDTLTTESSVFYAQGEKYGIANDYLVNLFLKQMLNADVKKEYNVMLMATDLSATPLSATIPVKITVKSENYVKVDRPEFEHKIYSATVKVKNKLLVSAEKLDVLPEPIRATIKAGNSINYEIDYSYSNFSNSFTLDSTNGELKLTDVTQLVQNGLTSISLFTRVVVNNDQMLTDFCLVNVRIVYLPLFEKTRYPVYVSRNAPVGSVLWTANAGPFVTYSSKDSPDYYDLDGSGNLRVNKALDKADDETINVIATGQDGKAETDVSVNIIGNGNPDISIQQCVIEENQENAICDSLNLDQSETYEIISASDDHENFKIVNHQLIAKLPLDYETRTSYILNLQAKVSRKTLYVTVKVKNVIEVSYFETEKKRFVIAPWMQHDHIITTFKAVNPDVKNAHFTYILMIDYKIADTFRLCSFTGELQWVKEPTETFYAFEIKAIDEQQPLNSLRTNIKVFVLQPNDIFSVKLAVNDTELDTKQRSIEIDLNEIIKHEVMFLYSKPDLIDESKFEFIFFALKKNAVLPYKQVENLLRESHQQLQEKLGEFSIHPHSSLLASEKQTNAEPDLKLTIIITLSVIICAMFISIIGVILCKKHSSDNLKNATSTKDLLKSEENHSEPIKIEKKNENALQTSSLPRIIHENEIVFEELTDEHEQVDDLHEIHDLDYELPEVDYKPGRRKSVTFLVEKTNDTKNMDANSKIPSDDDVDEREETKDRTNTTFTDVPMNKINHATVVESNTNSSQEEEVVEDDGITHI